MQLNDLEEKRVKNTIRRMATALRFLFNDKSDLYIGFYALLTARFLIKRYFEEDCESYQEFKNVKPCVLNSLSELTKTIYEVQFVKKEGK